MLLRILSWLAQTPLVLQHPSLIKIHHHLHHCLLRQLLRGLKHCCLPGTSIVQEASPSSKCNLTCT